MPLVKVMEPFAPPPVSFAVVMVVLSPDAGSWPVVICPVRAESAGTCPADALPLRSENAG